MEGRRGWARPLWVHLSAVIVLLLISIALPLMWVTWQQGTRAAEAAASQQMRLLAQQVIDRYRSIFGDGYATVTMAAVSDALLTDPSEDVDAKSDLLIGALSSSPFIDGIYAGYPSGAFVHAVSIGSDPAWKTVLDAPDGAAYALRTVIGEGTSRVSRWRFLSKDGALVEDRLAGDPSYDPRQRPWYESASGQVEPVAAGPYVMATTRKLGLTLARSMKRKTEVVVGADLLLETISRLLAQERVSENARGYVFDTEGRLIVHSDPAVMDQIMLGMLEGGGGVTDYADPVLEALKSQLGRLADTDDAVLRFEVNGVPYLGEGTTASFSDLVADHALVIAAPLSDFTHNSKRLLRTTLVVAATLLVAGIVAAFLVSRLVTNSLATLTSEARQIGDLDFRRSDEAHSHIDEINTLARTLASAREAIRNFAYYVPRELVRKIVASGQAAALGASRQEVTMIFTDIRDFTTISERHLPEEIVKLLSSYFELLNEIVEKHGGVILHFIGDGIAAVWNAPIADPDHVRRACTCVLDLKQAVDALNERNIRNGSPELFTRFGLHTGIAVVGNVGAVTRRQYTAMGDTVNVASRLEGINKEYGTSILVSAAVRERAGPGFDFKPLGFFTAKGRSEPVEVFELLQLADE